MKGAAHTFALADGSFNDPDPADRMEACGLVLNAADIWAA
jgi:hypothetical protein